MLQFKLGMLLVGVASCAIIANREDQRPSLINTRGTGEIQGESAGFLTMNFHVMELIEGGSVYNTVYAAGLGLDYLVATIDIINHISSAMEADPDMCFVLQGYSQGAIATIGALHRLSGNQAANVKAVVLLGNPEHKSGLECNIDSDGGALTKYVVGLLSDLDAISDSWVTKSLDICAFGDGVCDTLNGVGITWPHLSYPFDARVQDMGTQFIVQKLTSTS